MRGERKVEWALAVKTDRKYLPKVLSRFSSLNDNRDTTDATGFVKQNSIT